MPSSTLNRCRLGGRAPGVALLLGLLCLALLGSAPVAHASLAVQHDSYSAAESAGDGDGIIGPGDSFTLTEKVVSAETQTLTNVHGTLTSVDGSATVNSGASSYPNLTFGASTGNSSPFVLTVPAGADCGINLPLSLQIATDQGSVNVPFTVATGTTGTLHAYDSTQVPLAIPDNSSVGIDSVLSVNQAGRVKAVRVRIGSLTHTYDGDLLIQLVSPDGTAVTLINPNPANGGQNFTSTVFDQNASTAITSASAPYTGSFRPVGDLGAFVGKQQQGLWHLHVADLSPGNTGALNSWGADVTPAVCAATPLGSFTATPNPVLPGNQVTFDATGSRAPTQGATITDYRWDLDGSGNFATDSGTNPVVTRTYATRGKVNVSLKVTDSTGKVSAPITVPVSVTVAPAAALSVSPASPVAASPVTFDASASTHDPAGRIVDYQWDLDGSGNYATDTGSTPRATTTYPSSRTVPVHVRVTDDTGATAVAVQNVVIANAPPVAAFSAPSPILVGQPVAFDGSASHDPDGSIADFRWDLNGAGTYTTDTGLAPRVTTTYSSPGAVTVGLRVTDNQGASTSTTRTVQVTRPPVARISASPNPANAGQSVTLDAGGSSSPDGVIATYSWDLDGSGRYATSSGSTPFLVHAFPAAGSYPVGVKVTDNYGATAVASTTVSVTPGSTGGGGSLGGNLKAGIASLGGADQQLILPGSDKYFAAITGDPVRRAKLLASHGLWINCLADRAATFSLKLELSRADALTLKLVKRRRGRAARKRQSALVSVGTVTLTLTSAGQKPFNLTLGRRVARALKRLRRPVKLLVVGTASDNAGHQAQLTRVFSVRR